MVFPNGNCFFLIVFKTPVEKIISKYAKFTIEWPKVLIKCAG